MGNNDHEINSPKSNFNEFGEKEREILKKFLGVKVAIKSCPMPKKAVRCIKLAKALLGDGKVFIFE